MTKVRIIFEIYKNVSCFCEKLLTSIYVDTQTDCFTCDEISNVKVVRSIDPLLDKEAVRVVQSMPKWIPGKEDVGQRHFSFCKSSHSLSSLMTLGATFPASTKTFLPFR